MDDPTLLPTVDVDKGFAIALFLLLCVFLAMMIVRCARLIMDPYKDIPNSMWEDHWINFSLVNLPRFQV
uniref:Cortexin domain containing 1 n=1 Tax=Leptobrachium leishanense TaxID=445787 RepID=A0A8C5QQE3_9ANUR